MVHCSSSRPHPPLRSLFLLLLISHVYSFSSSVNINNTPFLSTVKSLASQLPTLQSETIVVKYGGNAMTSPELARGFCEDVATLQSLGAKIVVVHGGGPQISAMLNKLNVESTFSPSGLRISTPEVVDIAEMVLCGSVNKQIANGICNSNGRAIGLSGRDNSLLQCVQSGDREEIGFVGDVKHVNTDFLNMLLDNKVTPVLSPIGCGMGEEKDVAYNVNADVAAGRVAGELGASRVLFLTDIAGVLDKKKDLLNELSISQVEDLIGDETITAGMIPKVTYAVDAVKLGVQSAMIIDGRVPHALLKEVLYGDESLGGTTIRQ